MTPLDLNSSATRRRAFSMKLSEAVDAVISRAERLAVVRGIVSNLTLNPPPEEAASRNYIGASAIGDKCARRVQLDVWAAFHPSAPAINREPLDEKTRVIFARGHRTETEMASWLTSAFDDIRLSTLNLEGYQHGFVTGGGQIRGHADGIIELARVSKQPMLWETKTLGEKGWSKLWNHGLAKAHPKYDVQTQMLMAYLDLPATLFSALNADTGELYFEHVAFDTAKAQAASDRAVHILTATRAGELLPKASDDPTHFVCRFCRFKEECHPAG